MKLVKFLVNTLVYIVTFFVVMTAQHVTMWAISAGASGQVDQRVYVFGSRESSDNVYIEDSLRFVIDDISKSYAHAKDMPTYNVRNWKLFGNNKWRFLDNKFGKSLDIGWSYVKATVVPIFAPMYEVKELYTYYDLDMPREAPAKDAYIKDIVREAFVKEYEKNFVDTDEITAEDITRGVFASLTDYYDEDSFEFKFDIVLKDIIRSNTNFPDANGNYYKFLYNLHSKIEKYNSGAYDNYVRKFINLDTQKIKNTSVTLFYQLYLGLILAGYFTYQNEVTFEKNSEGQNEVKGRAFRLPKIRRRKNRNKKNRHREV
jgi:hypothetical protein